MQVLDVWRMIDPGDGRKGHAMAVFFTKMASEGLSRAFSVLADNFPVRPKNSLRKGAGKSILTH
jgi:hypothetical protein